MTGAPNRACARPEQLPDLKTGPKYEALTTYLKDAKQLKQLMQSPISTNPEASARTHFIANGFLDALADAAIGGIAMKTRRRKPTTAKRRKQPATVHNRGSSAAETCACFSCTCAGFRTPATRSNHTLRWPASEKRQGTKNDVMLLGYRVGKANLTIPTPIGRGQLQSPTTYVTSVPSQR